MDKRPEGFDYVERGEGMSEVDLDEVRKKHFEIQPQKCSCSQPWPCQSNEKLLADEIERLRKEFYEETETIAAVHDKNIEVFLERIERLREALPKVWDAGFSLACQQSCAGTNDNDKTDYRARDISAALHPETKEDQV